MPTLTKKKIKGNNYYYIVESKRIDGKPRPIVLKYLGTIDNILKHYSITEEGEVEYKSYSHGAVSALWEIAQKHGILHMMRSHFKDKKRDKVDISKSLLLAAIHRACKSGSKREFSAFAEETTLPQIAQFQADKLTSQHFWDQMDLVTDDEITAFQKELTAYLDSQGFISREKLSFDTTNFFTYIDSGNLAAVLPQRGHNKQKRADLRQFSLALMVSKDFFIPLSHYVYEGNMTDVGLVSPYIDRLHAHFRDFFTPGNVTLIFDKGCCSKANLKKIEEENLHYISSFSFQHKKDLLEIPLSDYENVLVKGKEIRTYRRDDTVWEKTRTVILYYSEKLRVGQLRGLNSSIEKKTEELKSLQVALSKPKTGIKKKEQLERKILEITSGEYGKELFSCTIEESPLRFEFAFDSERYDSITSEILGKKALITDQAMWSTGDILESYFNQGDIERVFKHLKNTDHHSVRPQYHWTDQKIRVHVFICLLGLLLTCILQKELGAKGVVAEKEHLLDVLGRIRQAAILRFGKKKNGKSVENRMEKMNEEEAKFYHALTEIVGTDRR